MIDEAARRQIAEYCAERDIMLAKCDVDEMIAFNARHNPGRIFSDRSVAEIALHKAITGVRNLPADLRMRSHAWLLSRGYESWLDEQ